MPGSHHPRGRLHLPSPETPTKSSKITVYNHLQTVRHFHNFQTNKQPPTNHLHFFKTKSNHHTQPFFAGSNQYKTFPPQTLSRITN